MDFRIAVDIGGTFTDGIACDEVSGKIWVAKCLTTPKDPGNGVADVVNSLLAQMKAACSAFTPSEIKEVVHATTLVTNTLIERKGANTALIVTNGFIDAPEIRREARYDLYDLNIELPEPLVPYDMRFEVEERVDAAGAIVEQLDENHLESIVHKIDNSGASAVAICLLHSYANGTNEVTLRRGLKARLPDVEVSISCEISPESREFERMSTVAANAYVQPLMNTYLGRIEKRLAAVGICGNLRIMQSSGGFTGADSARKMPIQLLESGPAAGVISAINAGRLAGHTHIVAFDMGGTTAKACLVIDGEPSLTRVFEAARVRRFKKGSGLPILLPSIDLIEIGAGGGSIASSSVIGSLAVGPHSAGSEPGPASYGRGGTEPTVTDADVMLGYIDPASFLGGSMKLDRDAAEEALNRLGDKLRLSAIETAWGICSVVNENMAGAARVHIAEKGSDPRDFTLVCTGGAGPVHAVDVARRLRIKTVLCPIAAGAGSCLGLLSAAARAERTLARRVLLSAINWAEIRSLLNSLQADAAKEIKKSEASHEMVRWSLVLEMRFAGQGHNVDVVLPYSIIETQPTEAISAAFFDKYRSLYGAVFPTGELEIATWRIVAQVTSETRHFLWADGRDKTSATEPLSKRKIYSPLRKTFIDAPVYDRYSLPLETKLQGPLILQERESTLVVPVPAAVSVLESGTVAVNLEG